MNSEKLKTSDVTQDSIGVLKSDLEVLRSRKQELLDLVEKLRVVDDKLRTLKGTRREIFGADSKLPGAAVLSLDDEKPGDKLVRDLEAYVQDNLKRVKFNSDLDGLISDRREVVTKLREIIPASIYKYGRSLIVGNFEIDIATGDVKLTTDKCCGKESEAI